MNNHKLLPLIDKIEIILLNLLNELETKEQVKNRTEAIIELLNNNLK